LETPKKEFKTICDITTEQTTRSKSKLKHTRDSNGNDIEIILEE
jgi:hypothetical protein